jgi:predicted SprT family Zn-dependent metalloprotease
MLTSNQKAIVAKVDELVARAKQLYPSCASLEIDSIKWNKGRVGGWAQAKRDKSGVVRYSLKFNAEATEKYFDDMLNNTVPHEVAHSVVQFHICHGMYGYGRKIMPHGVEWRRVCLALGGTTAERCHSYKLTAARKTNRYLYELPIAGTVEIGSKHHKAIQQGACVFIKKTKETVLDSYFIGKK